MPSYYYTKFQKNPCVGRNERCPFTILNFLQFYNLVCTKYYNFWKLGEIIHGPSQLELLFLYLISLPNAPYNLTKFRECFVKIAQRV